MSVKSRAAWIVKGGARTESALQQLGNDLRELQHKVESMAVVVDRLAADIATGAGAADVERIESAVAEVRHQLRTVTDDLGDRVGAVSQFLNSGS